MFSEKQEQKISRPFALHDSLFSNLDERLASARTADVNPEYSFFSLLAEGITGYAKMTKVKELTSKTSHQAVINMIEKLKKDINLHSLGNSKISPIIPKVTTERWVQEIKIIGELLP